MTDVKCAERVLLVIGEPGVGKSTALAHIIDRARCSRPSASVMSDTKEAETSAEDALVSRVVAWHVCRWNVSETLSPMRFAMNIASQLCRSVTGFDNARHSAVAAMLVLPLPLWRGCRRRGQRRPPLSAATAQPLPRSLALCHAAF